MQEAQEGKTKFNYFIKRCNDSLRIVNYALPEAAATTYE